MLLSMSGTTYGSAAMFVCEEGFVWRRGNNRSVCEADGLWRGGNMSCEGNNTPAGKITSTQVLYLGSDMGVKIVNPAFKVFLKGPLLYCFSSIYPRSQIYTEHVSDWLKHQTDHCSIPCFKSADSVSVALNANELLLATPLCDVIGLKNTMDGSRRRFR